jgi:hypothetical protein
VNKPGWATTEWWSTLLTQLAAVVLIVKPDLVVGGKIASANATAVVRSPLPSGAHTEPLIDK